MKKNILKSVLALCLVALSCNLSAEVGKKRIYIDYSNVDWWINDTKVKDEANDGYMGCHAWNGSGNATYQMYPSGITNVAYCDIDDSYTSLLIFRGTELSVSSGVWNQTCNYEDIGSNNNFTISNSQKEGKYEWTSACRWAPTAAIDGLKDPNNPHSQAFDGDGKFTTTLAAHSTYEFKILVETTAYGLDNNVWTGPITEPDYSLSSSGAKIRLCSAGEGEYTFKWNGTNHKLEVEYPDVDHPSMNYCYLFDHEWANGAWIYLTGSSSGVAGSTSWGTRTYNKTRINGADYFFFSPGDYTDLMVSDASDANKATGLTPTLGKYQKNISSSWGWRTFGGYTVTLNHDGAESYPLDPTVEFNGTAPSSITPPTKTGYVFGGYWSNSTCDELMIIDPSGAWLANKAGYTDGSKRWIHDGGTATLYAKWYTDPRVWCDPNVTVTGDVHLTSTKDVFVQSTTAASNLLNITSTDWGSATSMEIAYLNADAADAEVAKASSVFRIYAADATGNPLDHTSSTVDISASRTFNTDYSIRYTPSDYAQLHNYKLQLTFKKGDQTLKTVTHNLYGRSLPEEFVIAVKKGDIWVALPSNLASTSSAQPAIVPQPITVNNTTTPTEVTFAPTTVVYKATGRNAANKYMNGIRFTTTGNNWLQTAKDAYKMWLSTSNSDSAQVWYLSSTDFGAYTMKMDAKHNGSKEMGIYNSTYIGFHGSPNNANIYLLPIGTKYTPVEAEATDWTGDIIGLTATTSATKLGILQQNGTVTSPVALSSASTSHVADFNGTIDFTGLTDNTILLNWYEGASLIGGSEVTIPSIILAGANDEWSDFGGSAPTLADIVVLSKPMTVNTDHAKAKQIVIDKSDDNTGKLTIQANKGLEVEGTVKVYNGENFVATTAADLILESSSSGNASLVFDNSNSDAATVQMYSPASIGENWNWQFMGTPFTSASALYNYYGSYLYEWNAGGYWDAVANGGTMTGFKGYCITQDEATTYVMDGTLNPNNDVEITIPAEKEFVMANSWSAPIFVSGFTNTTLPLTDQKIYLFNTGHEETSASAGTAAGTYVAVPIHSAPYTGNDLIAPMEGFYVDNRGHDAATITLKYNELVRPQVDRDIIGGPMHAPKLAENEPAVMKIKATGSRYSERVVILEREDFSTGFDNGWDGKNINEPGVGTKDAVSAIPAYEGTVVGFRKGEDNAYTFSFEYDGEETLYLNDLKVQKSTLINAEHTYAFSTESGDAEARFIISATPIGAVVTGIESSAVSGKSSEVRKVLIEDQIYIIRGGKMYTAEGQMVK